MFDLDPYLLRIGIGLGLTPELAELHRAHVTAVPFENLDPLRGVPVSLQLPDLAAKLVARRRGGYCFEHNLVFKAALEALGASATPMLARVRWGSPPGTVSPLSHLLLRVERDGSAWHADVGFGASTLLEPIPLGPGGPYDQSGWIFRVIEDGAELVLQTSVHGAWQDVYAFLPQPAPLADIEVANWYTATHPSSRFLTGLIVARHLPDGTRVSLTDWDGDLTLAVRTPAESTVTPVERAAIPTLLDERFGLAGFALDDVGRVVLADGAGR